MVMGGALLVVLLIIILCLYFVCFKSKSPKSAGLLLSGIHFIIVASIVIFIGTALKRDGEIVMLFLPIYFIDFPSSLITIPLGYLFGQGAGNTFLINNFIIPTCTFLLFGSAQYYFIGYGIGLLFKRSIKK